jgi:Cupin domain
MLSAGDSFASRAGSRLTILEGPADNQGARIVFERVMPPGTGKADPHVHLDCDQRYEIEAGSATMELLGAPRTLGPGDKIVVPRRTPHRDPYNDSGAELRFRVEIEPCPPFIDAFGRALAEGYQNDQLTDQDELPILKILVLTKAYDGQSFRAGIPIGVQQAMLPLAAAIGRLRGYRPPTV